MRTLSGREVCEILKKHGFEQVRQRGSHIIMQKPIPGSTITVSVPDHRNCASAPFYRSSGKASWTAPTSREHQFS